MKSSKARKLERQWQAKINSLESEVSLLQIRNFEILQTLGLSGSVNSHAETLVRCQDILGRAVREAAIRRGVSKLVQSLREQSQFMKTLSNAARMSNRCDVDVIAVSSSIWRRASDLLEMEHLLTWGEPVGDESPALPPSTQK